MPVELSALTSKRPSISPRKRRLSPRFVHHAERAHRLSKTGRRFSVRILTRSGMAGAQFCGKAKQAERREVVPGCRR